MASMEAAIQSPLDKLIEKGLPVAVANTVAAEVLGKMDAIFTNKRYYRDPIILPGKKALRRYFGIDTEKIDSDYDENGKVIFILFCDNEDKATKWERKPLSKAEVTVYSLLYGETDKRLSQPANDKGFALASI